MPPEVPERSMRAVLFGASSLALLWLAGAYWPWQIDDMFITLAYAREWWTSGVLRWTSGELVEGYSNFLFLAALTPITGLGGDGAWWAKVFAFTSALGTVGVFAALVPADRRGAVVLLALVAWTPFVFWSMAGLETPWFMLLLTAGWVLAFRPSTWGPGVALLALASLTRPEGALYLGLGVLARTRIVPNGRSHDFVAASAIIGVVAWHVWRVAHFGHLLPTPFLAKFVSITVRSAGLAQWLREIGTASPLLATALLFRASPRRVAWAAIPLAAQSALLVRADGDWMGFGRFLVPGVVAFVATMVASGRPRTIGTLPLCAIAVTAITLAAFEPRADGWTWRTTWSLRHPLRQYAQGLGTPLPEDVDWAVSHVPWGATVLASDVGMLGNVPGLRVRDAVGLVDREIAELRASGRPFTQAEFDTMYGTGPGQVSVLRIVPRPGSRDVAKLDGWVGERLPNESYVATDRYFARWYTATDEAPTPDQVHERWKMLAERYPSQPWIAWRWMLAQVDAGVPIDALQPSSPPRWDGDALDHRPESLSFTRSSDVLEWRGEGFALNAGTTLTSRPLTAQNEVVLVVEGHGRIAVTWGTCPTTEAIVTGRSVDRCPPGCDGERVLVRRVDVADALLTGHLEQWNPSGVVP